MIPDKVSIDRLLNKLEYNPSNNCGEFTGSLSSGYGQIMINGKRQSAHRAIYEYVSWNVHST